MTNGARLRIGVVGGSGRIGRALRRELDGSGHSVVCFDLQEPPELYDGEQFRQVDISTPHGLDTSFAGLDGLVHLAGIPKEAPLDDILRINVAGTSNVYEAARLANVPRVVLGSSNHSIGYYPRDEVVGSDIPMRPDGLYGLSKCWGELVAGLYYDKYGVRSLIVRIGNASLQPTTARSLEVWMSPGDFLQLVMIGLTHPDVTATTVYGVSKGGGSWWDNSVAERLGYVPRDVIRDLAAPSALVPEVESEVSRHYQGARFASAGHQGGIRKR